MVNTKIVSFNWFYTPEQQRAWFKDLQNLELAVIPQGCTSSKICEMVSDADVIMQLPGTFLTREMLESAPKLKLVQFQSVGYDTVDLKAATNLGIPVANNPSFPSIPVAEHTIMNILVLLKQAFYSNSEFFKNNWVQSEVNGKIGELSRKTVGILGLGHIGVEVAKRLRPFGPKLIYTKRSRLSRSAENELGVKYVNFNDLIAESDILSVHVPQTPETINMVSREQIARMKPGAYIINTARGLIVDEVAVADALREGRLAGAAFDVPRYGVGDLPKTIETFKGCKNVLITPHTSSCSPESAERCVEGFTANIVNTLSGGKPDYVVNGV